MLEAIGRPARWRSERPEVPKHLGVGDDQIGAKTSEHAGRAHAARGILRP